MILFICNSWLCGIGRRIYWFQLFNNTFKDLQIFYGRRLVISFTITSTISTIALAISIYEVASFVVTLVVIEVVPNTTIRTPICVFFGYESDFLLNLGCCPGLCLFFGLLLSFGRFMQFRMKYHVFTQLKHSGCLPFAGHVSYFVYYHPWEGFCSFIRSIKIFHKWNILDTLPSVFRLFFILLPVY